MILNMKKQMITIMASLCLMTACTSPKPEPTPALPTDPVVQEDIGIQVIHAGYYERVESVVENRTDNVREAKQMIPDHQVIERYDYDGRKLMVKKMERDDQALVFNSETEYQYNDDGSAKEVSFINETGGVISKFINNKGVWSIEKENAVDEIVDGEKPEKTLPMDMHGNVVRIENDDGTVTTDKFNSNGFVTERTILKEKQVISKIAYGYTTNDHLPENIIMTDEKGNVVKDIYLLRGALHKNQKINKYYSTSDQDEVLCEIIDEYDEQTGLLISSIIKVDDTITLKLYEYK